MMTNYKRGRAFEYKVKKQFEAEGFLVVRSSMSHGPVDLVAVKGEQTFLIQCKKHGAVTKEELQELKEVQKKIKKDIHLAMVTGWGKIGLMTVNEFVK